MTIGHWGLLPVGVAALALTASVAAGQTPTETRSDVLVPRIEPAIGVSVNGLGASLGGFGFDGSIAVNTSRHVSVVTAASVWKPAWRSDGSVVTKGESIRAYLVGVKISTDFTRPNRRQESRRLFVALRAGLEHSRRFPVRDVVEVGIGVDGLGLMGRGNARREMTLRMELSYRTSTAASDTPRSARFLVAVVVGPRFHRR